MIDLSTVHAPDESPHPDCPHGDPMHDHGDGCPSCDNEQCPACRCIRGKFAAGEECEDRFDPDARVHRDVGHGRAVDVARVRR